MHDGWGFFPWYGVLFGIALLVLVIVGIIALVVFITRWQNSAPGPKHKPRDPLSILEERYAKGEIDKDEFEERRRALKDR